MLLDTPVRAVLGLPFVNVGRGSARCYCSATCGIRERVAAHREARDRAREIAVP